MMWLTDPVGWWIDPFRDAFMMRALLASLLAVLATSMVGIWVVLRGMTFLGDALAHAVLPGIAVAYVAGFSPTLGALIAALVMVGLINTVRSHSPLPEDTTIGVLFVGFLAFAVVLMSTESGAYVGDLNRFLFGSVLGVDNRDLIREAVVALVAVAAVVLGYRAMLVSTFDATQAQLLGLRPSLTHGVLLVVVAMSVVASFEAVGSMLVFGFLTAPPAAAALLVRRVPAMMVVAVLIGSISVILGLLISFHAHTAPSATMALCAVVWFVIAIAVRAGASSIRAVRT
jgi:manganese/iron transport system permease protein